VKACDIWLCNRQPERWRKLKHVELTGRDGANLFPTLSDKELDQRIAAKLIEIDEQTESDKGLDQRRAAKLIKMDEQTE